ncbi:zinc-binding dehydrogenase [Marinitenerispora sediminis]|uniref:Zinc-binding alcohol dehydrogenase n=1 Tax=Marinitenerispora sediminis TaxID=1931232 RepID=A0A368T4R3_9ACTN|nr:zinc-binding dehydrogenase [Marinitenerispora sediminis]RCV50010.1 zinc-binding alcohol dehydrogenase [Marinitenerispora sediminis]RCV54066.1 zinc-binding alcohol dehydrogenase [Marinitenerispora sediminis]RCV58555.1 zinc-binding alcohol dehydrogenase [Marinitenerispora sediminis]
MRAAFMPGPGVLEVGDFEVPGITSGQVLVAMRHASVCGSDVHVVFDGFHQPDRLGAPGYPGHEGVGVVADSRSGKFPPGTPVLTVPPGRAGGCFAEFQAVDGTHLLALPAGSDLRRLLPAQQLGTTLFAMRKFLRAGAATGQAPRSAAVIGAGSAGLFFLQQLRRLGCAAVVVSDLNRDRLAVAERLGATRLVHAPAESVVEAALDLTGGTGVDLVVEAAGYDRCRQHAVEAVRPRGTLGFFGYPESSGTAPFPVHLAFQKSVTVEWAAGTQFEPGLRSFREAVDLILRGEIRVDHCLERAFPLEEAPAALAAARRQGDGAAKIGIAISEGDR